MRVGRGTGAQCEIFARKREILFGALMDRLWKWKPAKVTRVSILQNKIVCEITKQFRLKSTLWKAAKSASHTQTHNVDEIKKEALRTFRL